MEKIKEDGSNIKIGCYLSIFKGSFCLNVIGFRLRNGSAHVIVEKPNGIITTYRLKSFIECGYCIEYKRPLSSVEIEGEEYV